MQVLIFLDEKLIVEQEVMTGARTPTAAARALLAAFLGERDRE